MDVTSLLSASFSEFHWPYRIWFMFLPDVSSIRCVCIYIYIYKVITNEDEPLLSCLTPNKQESNGSSSFVITLY